MAQFVEDQPIQVYDSTDTLINPAKEDGHLATIDTSTATVAGAVTANVVQSNTKQINGTTVSVNNGTTDAGTQRVTLSSDSTGQVKLATGANVIGQLTADQSVNVDQIHGTATDVNTGNASAGTQRVVLATNQPAIPVTSSPTFQTRSDTYTVAGAGTTLNASTAPVKSYAISVKGTGAAATSWTVVLEGSLDNVNFTTILTHKTGTGDGNTLVSGSVLSPLLYFRSHCTAVALGSATNLVVTILGID